MLGITPFALWIYQTEFLKAKLKVFFLERDTNIFLEAAEFPQITAKTLTGALYKSRSQQTPGNWFHPRDERVTE